MVPAESYVDAERLQIRDVPDRLGIAHIGDEDGRLLRGQRRRRRTTGDTGPEDHRVSPREAPGHPSPPRAMKSA